MVGISDQTLIKAVRITYREKGRPVTAKEVVPAIKRLIGDKKAPKRPRIISRMYAAIVDHEANIELGKLASKKKIKRVIINHKEYYKPL